jgi:hypothetical protein
MRVFRCALFAALLSPLYPQSAPPVDFTRDVEPVLAKRCSGCHGAGQQMAGLRLDEPTAAMKGSKSGPVIIPGKSAESKLIQRVASKTMPPVGDPLTPEQVSTLRTWIDEGAKWPERQARGAQGNSKSSHWSFQPVATPAVPAVNKRDWPRNAIDTFVLARLESEKIEPSPEASRTTLIRRLSFDLIGLPPTPSEVADFLADTRPDAYERVVDRLLASPHYGEKWARQWLDLAHYADSDGYEKDQVRPFAWRYRNWVIKALNDDMRFDQFTLEQIAGDLLPHATTEQRVATGFHRTVLTNREAGVDRAEARFEQTINRTNTIGTVFLGLTVGCAQCHNHKFDPIAQKEYYQLLAFVNNVEEIDIDAPLPGETGAYLRARAVYERDRASLLEQHGIAPMQAEWEAKIRQAIQNPGKDLEWDFQITQNKAMVDRFVKVVMTDPAQRSKRDAERLTNYFLRTPGPDLNKDMLRIACIRDARRQIDEIQAALPPYAQAMTVIEDSQRVPTNIAIKGDYKSPGDEVQPNTLAVLPPLHATGVPDRLALARWIASKDNPLTARVVVNRMWQEFFGKGLVRTSDDFGTQGERPSHPELLDWLASEFMANGWSMKQMHKTIVMSATYRQSSNTRKELSSRDPDNSLLARQSRMRLAAELIRDAALSTSGLLDDRIGGPSVRPPQPKGVAELGYANSVKWVESTGADRYRRGLYVHYQRTAPYPQLVNFDEPDSNVACTRRTRSNTPLQALNLLNDPVFLEAAQAFAMRILKESPGTAFNDRLDYAYHLALARKPAASERDRLSRLFNEQHEILKADAANRDRLLPLPPEGIDAVDGATWVGISRVLLNLDEFFTRE